MTPRYNTCALVKMLVCVCCGRSVLFFAMRLWYNSIQEVTPFQSSPEPSSSAPLRCPAAVWRSSLARAFTTSAPRVCRFLSRSYAILFRCCAFLRSAFWASALAAAAAAFSLAASSRSCGGQRHLFLVCLSTSAVRFCVAASSSRGMFPLLAAAPRQAGLSASLLQGCCLCQDVQGLHRVHLWVCAERNSCR